MDNIQAQFVDFLKTLRLLPRRKGSAFDRFHHECLKACELMGITNPAQIAYIFATVEHETAGTFKPVKEAYWLSESWRKRRLRYYPWYGRGFVQLTWERNYKKADNFFKLNGKLIADPDLLIKDYELSMGILIAGMKYGWFTGKRLDDYINRTTLNFRGARKIINGADRDAHIARLAAKYVDLLPQIEQRNGA